MLVVAGVDLAAGRGITEIAVLRANSGSDPPRWDAASQRAVITDAQIVDALAAARPSVIAIDAPLSLPAAVSAALRSTPAPDPAGMTSSPYTRAAERDPLWSELGARPLPVSFLGGLTFRALALLPRLRAALPDTRTVETWPTGVYRSLGIAPRLPASPKTADKTSPAWRGAVQTALTMHIAGLPAPGDAPLGADLLDALAAALAALAFARNAYRAVGDADEGQIILPLPLAYP